MEREDFVVNVYKKDARYKDGERIDRVIRLDNETQNWVDVYVEALRRNFWTADKYRVEVKKSWTTVRSLMTGKEVEIRTEDRGTVCDPSQERFWSM